MAKICIAGLEKAEVLSVLVAYSRLPRRSSPAPISDDQQWINDFGLEFECVWGRCDISGGEFDTVEYDRHNGRGTGQQAIDSLRC